MNKRLLFILVAILCTLNGARAQKFGYSNDAKLIKTEANSVILESSGEHEKRKSAVEQGVKSAINTLLFTGVDGVFNGKPLVPKTKQEDPKLLEYVSGLLDGGRYNIFVKGYSEQEKRSKTFGKTYQAIVWVEIYNEGLYRDMVKNKVIPEMADKMNIGDVEEQLAQMPSIMAVPMRKEGKDYSASLKDKNVRMAITAVDQEFINLGVNTKDFQTVLDKIGASAMLNSPQSIEDMLLAQSGADVYVTVDLEMDTNPSGTSVNLSLRAAETGTGRTLAAQQLNSARFNTTNIASICTALCKSAMGDFLKQITTSFAKKVASGLSFSIEVTMAPGSSIDLNERVGSKGMPIKLVVKQYVRDNSKDGKYETNGETSTRLQFDRVFVPGKVDEFSDNFSMFLFDNGVSHKSSFIDNTLRIVID